MPQIKKLKEGRLIEQDDRNTYKLSEIGEIVVEKMEAFMNYRKGL